MIETEKNALKIKENKNNFKTYFLNKNISKLQNNGGIKCN